MAFLIGSLGAVGRISVFWLVTGGVVVGVASCETSLDVPLLDAIGSF